MGCWGIKDKECCFFLFLLFPRNARHKEKNIIELHRIEIAGKTESGCCEQQKPKQYRS